MDWAKETAAAVRADLKAAQRTGILNPRWNISVRKDTASMMQAVNVRVTNADRDTMIHLGEWSDTARALATTLHRLTSKYAEQANGRHRFFDVTFAGLGIPNPHQGA